MSKPTRDEPNATSEASATDGASRSAGPELRLIDRKAFVGLGAFDLAPGLRIADLTLQIPNVSFPFNVTGGAARYQKQRCLFGQLDLEIAPARIREAEERILKAAPELARLRLYLRAGFIEAEGALRSGGKEPVPFTCRIAFDGAGEGVAALAFDVRLYAPCELSPPLVAQLLARAAARAGIAPSVELRGLGGVATQPLGELLRRTVPQKGFRLPETSAARLGSALVSPQAITLRFSAGAPPPGGLADEELLLAVEGAHAFDEGERLLESGQLQRAREFFLRVGELAQAHPFATERLISLLLGDPDVSDYALDLVRALAARRPLSPAPIWMEALLRLQRGERLLAVQRFLDLAALARGRGEEASAFSAAQAAAQLAADEKADERLAPLAVRALHESLGLRPDHHPSLLALAQVAERAHDDAAALRAYRRLTAVSRDSTQAARAHVRLGELCARVENDLAGARLHYDAALRLAPDDADALLGLADLCARSGEPLRALKSLDRVRELHPRDLRLAGRAELEAGAVYEQSLNQLENARLRYLEAARALAGDPEPLLRIGRVDERLNRIPEALDVLTQALELLGPKPTPAAHEVHRLLARIARDRLQDGARQREHLEAAVRLRPDDAEAWEELIPLYRADDAHARLAEALARASARVPEVRGRVAMLVESAELLRLRLGQPDSARSRYAEALALDPRSKTALEGILALDELFGDMGAACEHLRLLLELSPPGPARLPLLRRLATAARDGKKDLDLAARATRELLALAPDDLASLSDLVLLQRRRGDLPALAEALESWARGCERSGDAASTATALRELAALFDARLGRRDDALSALEKAHALAPQDTGVLADLADLALRAGRHRLARYATRALLGLLPAEGAPNAPGAARRAELHDRLGRAAEAVGELAEAAAALEEAYRLVPDDGHAERLDALYALARRDDARIDLARRRGAALVRAGKATLAANVFAQGAALARAIGDLSAANRDYTAALAADPTGPGAVANLDALAELAIAAGQPGEAAGHLAKRAALTGEPRAAARLLLRAAQLCFGADEPRALSLLASASARDAAYAPARAALAERRARGGDLAAAWRDAEAALDADPRDPDAIDASAQASLERQAARWADQSGDRAASARLLGRLLQRHPDDTEALSTRVALLRTLGDAPALALALEQLEGHLAGAAAASVARELARLNELSLSRIDQAIAAHRRVLRIEPDDRDALAALARLLAGPSEVDERVEVLGRLAILARTPEEAAALQLRRGEVLSAALRHADAAAAFAQASRSAPDPAPALELLIAAADDAGQAAVALAARRERAELAGRRGEPGAAEALLDVAGRYLALENSDEARTALDRVIALAPPPAVLRAAHQKLAALAKAAGQTAEVLRHQRALAELAVGAEKLEPLRATAEAAIALGDDATARQALLSALVLSPRDPELVRPLVDVQHRLGDLEGEVEALTSLARLTAEPAAAADCWARAARLLHAEHPSRAEAALRHALEARPDRGEVRSSLVELLLARGATAEAVELLSEGAAHQADAVAAARSLLGAAELAEVQLGDRALSLKLTRSAFERAPELHASIFALAERSYHAGAVAEAAPLLARTLELLDGRADPERWIRLALALTELRVEQGQPALAVPVLKTAAELAPWRADIARALHRAERIDDPKAALERFTHAIRALQPSATTHGLLLEAADAAFGLDDKRRAAALLEEALPTATEDREQLESRLIALHLELGHARGAVALLRAQAERAHARGDDAAALPALARAAELIEAGGEPAEAFAIWGAVVELHVARGRLAEAAAVLRRRGLLARDLLRRADAAERDFRRALELDPSDLESVRLAQEAVRARGDAAAEAELLTLEHDRLEDGAARARVLLRRAELERGPLRDLRAAEASLRNALALEPVLTPARDLYEELLRASGRGAELAHSLISRASGAPPQAAVAHLREAARLLGEAGQREAAADALDQARALAPDDDLLALAAADALAQAGRADDAAFIDAALLARDPAREPCFSRERARRERSGDRRGLAVLVEARALGEPPAEAALRFLEAARLFDAANEPESARRCELWAFERAPGDDAAFERVVARHQQPQHLRVLDGILRRRASVVETAAVALHLQRAELLIQHDETDAAQEALDDALSLGETGPDALRALVLRADLEAKRNGPAAASRFDERLVTDAGLSAADRIRILSRLAETRAAAGRDADACALWEAALAGAPREAALELTERLASAYARLGAPARQAEILLARAELVPSERESLLRAAAELAQGGPIARRALTELANSSADPATLLKLARLELAEGDLRGRERLVEAARAAVVPSVQAALLLEAAALFDAAGDRVRARTLRGDARRADANNLDALRQVAKDLRDGGELPERREVLLALVELEPDVARRAELRRELAELLADHDPQAAHAQLVIWAQLAEGPERLSAWTRIEAFARSHNAPARLADALEQLASLEDDGAPGRLLEAASCWLQADEPGRARAALHRAASRDTASTAPLQALVDLARGTDDPAELARAEEALAARLSPIDRCEALVRAADAWGRAGRADAALLALRSASALAPERYELQKRLAEAALAQDQKELALEALQASARHAPEPEQPEVFRAIGRLADTCGDTATAERAWRELWSRLGDEEAFHRLAAHLRARGNRRELARIVADRAERTSDLAGRLEAARAWEDAGDASEALRAWVAAHAQAPAELTIARSLMAAAERAGDGDALVAALTALARLETESGVRGRLYDRLAGLLTARGAAAEALAALRSAADAEPDSRVRIEKLVDALEAAGQAAEAAARLAALAEPTPEQVRRRASLLAQSGAGLEAALGYVDALAANPADLQSIESLRALAPKLQPAERVTLLAKWAPIAPRSVRASLFFDLAELSEGPARRDALERSFAADPAGPRAFGALRDLLADADEDRALAELLEKRAGAIQDQRERAQLLMELGELYEGALDALPEAYDAYERSLRAEPGNPGVQRDLAELAFDLGRDERARELFVLLAERGPDKLRPLFLERLATLAARNGAPAEAVRHLEARLALEPTLELRRELLEQARAAAEPEAELRAARGLLGEPSLSAPERAELLRTAASLERKRGQLDAALRDLVELTALEPDSLESWRLVRELAASRQEQTLELEAVTRLAELEKDPHGRAMMLLDRARILGDRGDHLGAAEAAFSAHALTPGDELPIRAALEHARAGKLTPALARAGKALAGLAGVRAVMPFARELGDALVATGDGAALAFELLGAARTQAPEDRALLATLVELAKSLGNEREALLLARELALGEPEREAASALRKLAAQAGSALSDEDLAAELFAEAFARMPPSDAELVAQAERLGRVGRARDAAFARAELVLRSPGDADGWSSLAKAARAGEVLELVRATEAVEAFLAGGLPELPSQPAGDMKVREAILSPLSKSWRAALSELASKRWAELAPAAASLRPGGPVLVGRLHALADAAGVARPTVRMDPGSNRVAFAGPDALVIGIGLFSLPARAQDYVLALSLVRASFALPFGDAKELVADLARKHDLEGAPTVEQLESMAEALAAAVVDDGLGALVGRTVADPEFAQADPRAWDRAAALAGPAQRGAAALVSAVLARLRGT